MYEWAWTIGETRHQDLIDASETARRLKAAGVGENNRAERAPLSERLLAWSRRLMSL